MDILTYYALRKSIKIWERRMLQAWRDQPITPTGPDNCPLCKLYLKELHKLKNAPNCFGCPIYQQTEAAYCKSTPLDKAGVEIFYWLFNPSRRNNSNKVKLLLAIKQEVDFLKSLLPNESPSNQPNPIFT